MRHFISILFLLFTMQAAAQTTQQVQITNIEKKKGKLYIGWYNSKETFMKAKKTVFVKIVDVNNQDEVKAAFEKIPPGKYAISVFLDENDNQDLDLNLVGIPQEKYGFSNGTPTMRPATYKECEFEVNGKEQTIVIKLK